jgi:SNF family Na+-dependent transporter
LQFNKNRQWQIGRQLSWQVVQHFSQEIKNMATETNTEPAPREGWGSQIGLVLAMAGNAVGLGNFLRFPALAAKNGGGTFMIPYFISLLLLGIPLMWIEWGIGRLGGRYGHSTSPGMFHVMWKHPFSKYLGALGVFIPLAFVIYYTYIESWTLGYAVLSFTNQIPSIEGQSPQQAYDTMGNFLAAYQGTNNTLPFSGTVLSVIFFIITLFANVFIISRGLAGGIEKMAKIGMPLLILFAIVVGIRVLSLPGAMDGVAFVWNPDFSKITDGAIWLAAAGQIFFTLSLGTGSIETYASYLKEDDDIVLTGLATTSMNEFCEVILGGSISIPAAAAFFGPGAATAIANSGTFNLGFQTMPAVFSGLPGGSLFGGLFFTLLFFAGITSSLALAQPTMAFLQDELKMTRNKAALAVGAIMFFAAIPIIMYLQYGFLDEFDFWAGAFLLLVFSLIEVILFFWIFGGRKAWDEIRRGQQINLPGFFYPIMKYVVPILLIVILIKGAIDDMLPRILFMRWVDVPGWSKATASAGERLSYEFGLAGRQLVVNAEETANFWFHWGARIEMLLLYGLFIYLVSYAWRKYRSADTQGV